MYQRTPLGLHHGDEQFAYRLQMSGGVEPGVPGVKSMYRHAAFATHAALHASSGRWSVVDSAVLVQCVLACAADQLVPPPTGSTPPRGVRVAGRWRAADPSGSVRCRSPATGTKTSVVSPSAKRTQCISNKATATVPLKRRATNSPPETFHRHRDPAGAAACRRCACWRIAALQTGADLKISVLAVSASGQVGRASAAAQGRNMRGRWGAR